jgi:uncharacterized protein (TIRG00374 family)
MIFKNLAVYGQSNIRSIAKLLITSVFVFLLFRSVDFGSLILLKDQISIPYLVLFLLISWPMIWASCVKWKFFISSGKVEISTIFLMKIYLISYFVNLFLPSTLGGDAIRSFHLGKKISNHSDAFAATFFEKLTGVFTLSLVSIFGLIFSKYENFYFLSLVIILFIGVTSVFIFLFTKKGQKKLIKIYDQLPNVKYVDKIFNILSGNQIDRYSEPFFLCKVISWSLFFYSLAIFNTYLGILAISVDGVSLLDLALVVPLVLLIASIPITPGAIGVQEGAFVFFLSSIGLSSTEALGVALLLRLKVILLAIVGWIIYLRSKKEIPQRLNY